MGAPHSTAFEIGKAYYARSLCDSEAFFFVLIKARTRSTVITEGGQRFRIKLIDGVETIAPKGRYSMSPTIHANARPLQGSEKEQMDRWIAHQQGRPTAPDSSSTGFDTTKIKETD